MVGDHAAGIQEVAAARGACFSLNEMLAYQYALCWESFCIRQSPRWA